MKRLVLVLLALAMMFALCAVAEEVTEDVTEESSVMYVANCGTLSVYKEPSYDSRRVGKIRNNMEVEVIGEEVKSGHYTFVLVRGTDVTAAPKTVEGYVNAKYLTAERVVRNTTGAAMSNTTAYTAPSDKAEKVSLSFLENGCVVPMYAIFKIEYFAGDYAYISAKINGERVEIGYINDYFELPMVVGTAAEVAAYPSRFVKYDFLMPYDTWNDIR